VDQIWCGHYRRIRVSRKKFATASASDPEG
jgi:hypothetical protein